MGSPINNRALFPCQEPPVAMSTWQARVRAPCDYTVLMSGENQAFPEPAETGRVKSSFSADVFRLNMHIAEDLYFLLQVFYSGIIMLRCQCQLPPLP